MNSFTSSFLIFSTLLAGLIAGFFYTWSFTIMQSLNLIEQSMAATAMNSINTNIRSGWFAIIFFGAPVAILISLILLAGSRERAFFWVAIALLLAVGTLVITFTRHIPLNERLAEDLQWGEYFSNWVQWNHARMLTSVLAFLSMLCALFSYASASK